MVAVLPMKSIVYASTTKISEVFVMNSIGKPVFVLFPICYLSEEGSMLNSVPLKEGSRFFCNLFTPIS
jgi:hypothetical protein